MLSISLIISKWNHLKDTAEFSYQRQAYTTKHFLLILFSAQYLLKLCFNPMKNDMIYGNRKRALMEIHHFNCMNGKWFSDFDGFTWVSILMRAYSKSVWILSVDVKKICQFATLYQLISSGWFFRNKLDIC